MDHNKVSFQSLRDLFPDVESPVTCNDIYNRILPIRDLICDALGSGMDSVYTAVLDAQTPVGSGPLELFESDKALREHLADLSLVLFLSVELSQDNGQILYIPKGFAHGFLVLSDSADVVYKCTAEYSPKHESGVIWNDPQINVVWPGLSPVLSRNCESARITSFLEI